MKDINIVLVNYFSKDELLQTLSALFFDLSGFGVDAQVTVVDNSGNKDEIKSKLHEKFPQVDYIETEKNLGFGKGNTLGFKNTEARYYMTLNPDVIIPSGTNAILNLVKFMDENKKIGCAGPKLVNPDKTLQYSCYRFDKNSILIKPLKHLNWDKKYKWVRRHADRLQMKDFEHNRTQPVDWVQGSAMIVRGEAIKKVGWFDERYFFYMEDCDWCRSLWDAGWPVYYVHDIVLEHRHARDSSRVPGIFMALLKNKLARYHLIGWLKFVWKWRKTYKYL